MPVNIQSETKFVSAGEKATAQWNQTVGTLCYFKVRTKCRLTWLLLDSATY